MNNVTKQTGIYKITNIISGKFYVGSSAKKLGIRARIMEHKSNLKRNKHCNKYLQSAWNKHGEDSFKFDIIEVVDDKNKILEREQHYLDLLKPYNREIGYNISKIAGSQLGYTHTKETKDKMCGLKRSEKSKKLMSESHIGLPSFRKVKVIQLDLIGNQIKIWDSMVEVERTLKINHGKISEVCSGKRKTSGGYKWKYVK